MKLAASFLYFCIFAFLSITNVCLFASETNNIEAFDYNEGFDSKELQDINKNISGWFEYAGTESKLSINGQFNSGWDFKDDSVTNTGSRIGSGLIWGVEWCQTIAVEAFSSSKMWPAVFESSPEGEIDLNTFGLLLGNSPPNSSLPKLGYTRYEYLSEGIVNNDATAVLKSGNTLSPGDRFDVGIKYDIFYLSWDFGGNNHYTYLSPVNNTLHKPNETMIGRAKIGYAQIEWNGVKERVFTGPFGSPLFADIEEYNTSGLYLELAGAGYYELFDPIDWYFGIDFESISPGKSLIGSMKKIGYEIGLAYQLNDLFIKSFVGGYLWFLGDFRHDYEGLETDIGYTFGLSAEYRF